jgi:hypothetical protein
MAVGRIPEGAAATNRISAGGAQNLMAQPLKDITGNRYEKLFVMGYAGPPGLWRVRCDCGTEKVLRSGAIKHSKSCGCARWDFLRVRNFKHGDASRGKTAPELNCWRGLIRRCTDPKDANYQYYGGRGIKVCERWLSSYPEFLEDMGRRPSRTYSIDRIDNNGNYEPNNCKWATKTEQMRNRRGRRLVSFFGSPMPASEAAEMAGITYDVFLERLNRGWSEERALLTPVLAPFGGTGAARFSHSTQAASLAKISGALRAYGNLSEPERVIFERVLEP